MLLDDVAVHFLCVVRPAGLVGLVILPGVVQKRRSGINDQLPVFYVIFQCVDHPFQFTAGLLRA